MREHVLPLLNERRFAAHNISEEQLELWIDVYLEGTYDIVGLAAGLVATDGFAAAPPPTPYVVPHADDDDEVDVSEC